MKVNYKKTGVFCVYLLFTLFSYSLLGQVGINNSNPKTTLDINGALSLREGPPIALGNTNGNNINLGENPYSFYRITGDAGNFDLTGVIPSLNVDGQRLILVNMRNGDMTVKNESSASDETNRIYVPGEKDFTLKGKHTSVTLQYSNFFNRWLLLNKSNHMETWEYNHNIVSGNNILTALIPGATRSSSVSVNFSGDITNSNDLFLEYVESRNESVVFRIRNTGSARSNVGFVITINKI